MQTSNTTRKQSIFRVPIGKPAGLLTLIAILVVLIWTDIHGATSWLTHRTILYHGKPIPMPFSWLYEPNQIPFTIYRPSWRSFGFASDKLSIDERHTGEADFGQTQTDFDKRWHRVGFDITPPSQALTDASGNPLWCVNQTDPYFHNIEIKCEAPNKRWMFDYDGRPSEIKQIQPVVTYILSHESQFPTLTNH